MEIVEHGIVHAHDHGHAISREYRNYVLKFGWWVYIASEVMLFASFIGTALLAKRLYPEQQELLAIPLTTFATFILLTSSWTMVRALASAQDGDQIALARALFLTALLGAIFVGIQFYEYTHLSHEGLTLSSSMFGSAFYVLTGFHGAHVLIGVIWILATFVRALNGHFTKDNWIGIEILGLYWHFVDVVWVFIFPLIYLL